MVWLSSAHLPLRDGARKLAVRWTGPFRVTELVGPAAVRLALPAAWRIHNVFHVSQLKANQGEVATPAEPLLVD